MPNKTSSSLIALIAISLSSPTAFSQSRASIKALESLPEAPTSSSSTETVASKNEKDTLSGGYIGLTASLTHMSMKIDSQTFSGSGPFGGIVIGGGKKVRKAYISGELDVNYGSLLATKKPYGKVSSHMDIGFNLRVGYSDKNKIIPYLRLGFGWNDYQFKQNGTKQKFNTAYFAPGLGIEIPILSASFLRLEAAYSMNLGNKTLKNHTLQSKPSRILIKAGGFTRF